MVKKYVIINKITHLLNYRDEGAPVEIGDYVYEFDSCDYGLAIDDSYFFNEEYISVTTNPKGLAPAFTVPVRSIKEIKDEV